MIQMDANKLKLREGLLECLRVGRRDIAYDGTVTLPHTEHGKEYYLYCEEESLKTGIMMKARVRHEHLQTFHIDEKEAWDRAFLNAEAVANEKKEEPNNEHFGSVACMFTQKAHNTTKNGKITTETTVTELLDKKLISLGLHNALKRAKVNTVYDILCKGKDRIQMIKGIGKTKMLELEVLLRESALIEGADW